MGESEREKNIRIIRKRLDHELDLAFRYIDNRISHLYGGITGIFLNPVIKFFYTFLARNAIRRRARKQLQLIVHCASEFDGKNLEKIVDEHLEEYLLTEEAFIRGNKRHPKFGEVTSILREIFKGRLLPLTKLLSGSGETYEELTRSVFPKRKDVEAVCSQQFELVEKLIKMIREEKNLVKIPGMIRREVFAILDSGYEFAKKVLKEQLDETYK
jgi:hypothetical protein